MPSKEVSTRVAGLSRHEKHGYTRRIFFPAAARLTRDTLETSFSIWGALRFPPKFGGQ